MQDEVIQWANFVKVNPSWKKIHTDFINAQYTKHKEFVERLLKSPGGRDKLDKLFR